MAGRYYYRPIDPGYDQLGAGIGQGLVGLASGISQRRERKRQDAATARQEERQNALFDLELAGMGGGRGYVPTVRSEAPVLAPSPAPARTGSALLDPAAWLNPPTDAGGPGLRFTPDAVMPRTPLRTSANVPDPRYRQFGTAEHPFYVEDPEVRANRMADAAFGRKLDEMAVTNVMDTASQEALVQRSAAALRASHPDMSEEEATANARLMIEARAPYSSIFPKDTPETFTPRPTGEGTYSLFGSRGTIKPTETTVPPAELTGSPGVTPTSIYGQQAQMARGLLNELEWIDHEWLMYGDSHQPGEKEAAISAAIERYGMTPQEARAIVMRTARAPQEGEGNMPVPMLQYPDSVRAPATSRPRTTGKPAAGGNAAAPTGGGEGDTGAGAPEDANAPLNDAEIRAVITKLATTPRGEWEARMKARGFTEAQIKQVLSARQ